MFASMIVSLTGVALPLVAGACLAPKDGRKALLATLQSHAWVTRFRGLAAAQRRKFNQSLAAAFHPAHMPVRSTSQGHFG